MRSFTTLYLGLFATAADALVPRAVIDKCLADAGVPVDTKGTTEYATDVAPFNIRLPYIPTVIAVPLTTEHIKKSVLCGKKLGIKVSAKSGGHSYASFGLGGENGHILVELDRMYNVTYNAASNVATAQPGARLGHLATVLYEKYGRAVAHGTCPHVGISGHFAHGGFGFSSHTHGLALDFVVGATVVLADGNVVETSETNRADLFWGIRGAGSNFGIVAQWKLKTIPAPPTLARFIIPLHWNKSTALQGLLAVEKFAKTQQPKELNFRIGDYGKGNPQIEALFYGTLEQGRAALQPLLDAQPVGWEIAEASSLNWIQAVISFSNYETVDWTTPAPQENFYAKSLALKGLNGTSAQNFVDYYFDVANNVVDRFWFFQLDIHGGATSEISKVPNSATAYAHRDKLYLVQLYDRYQNNETYPASSFGFLDGFSAAITDPLPASDWGAYANYADSRLDRATAQRLYYGVNLRALQKLKAKYDPTELFYYPQSIEPIR